MSTGITPNLNTFYDFQHVTPGDFVFITNSLAINIAISILQSFQPSVSSLGAAAVHVGIVLSKKEDEIEIAHSFGPFRGAVITTYRKTELEEDKEKLIFVSPISPDDTAESGGALRGIIVNIGRQFAGWNSDIPPTPCSYARLTCPFFYSSRFSDGCKRDISESIVDFARGFPRIGSFDKDQCPVAKAFVCSEFAYSVFQLAVFVNASSFSQDQVDQIRSLPSTMEGREEAIEYVYKNFNQLFEKIISNSTHLALQHHLSFTSGHLLSELQKRRYTMFRVTHPSLA